jgi:hypothetical protein
MCRGHGPPVLCTCAGSSSTSSCPATAVPVVRRRPWGGGQCPEQQCSGNECQLRLTMLGAAANRHTRALRHGLSSAVS